MMIYLNPDLKTRWRIFRGKAKEKTVKAVHWIEQNPESFGILTTLGVAVIGGTVKITKGLIRKHNINKEQYIKERYVYDRSLGMYLHLKRPLTNKDYISINNRRKNGERLSEILKSMNVLS